MRFMTRKAGFTLLEVMVSISIFSVLGLGAYQMLQTVVKTNERVKASADNVIQVSGALQIIQRDLNQFVPRPVRDGYGEPLAPLVFDGDDYAIEFTRTGWSNPAGRPRSRLQRVAYSIDYDEEQLFRHFWEVLDRAEDSEPRSQLLLDGVTDFRVTGFTDDSSDTLDTAFELDETTQVAPIGVEVVIATESLGEVQRLFQMVDPMLTQGNQGQPSDDANDGIDGADEDAEGSSLNAEGSSLNAEGSSLKAEGSDNAEGSSLKAEGSNQNEISGS